MDPQNQPQPQPQPPVRPVDIKAPIGPLVFLGVIMTLLILGAVWWGLGMNRVEAKADKAISSNEELKGIMTQLASNQLAKAEVDQRQDAEIAQLRSDLQVSHQQTMAEINQVRSQMNEGFASITSNMVTKSDLASLTNNLVTKEDLSTFADRMIKEAEKRSQQAIQQTGTEMGPTSSAPAQQSQVSAQPVQMYYPSYQGSYTGGNWPHVERDQVLIMQRFVPMTRTHYIVEVVHVYPGGRHHITRGQPIRGHPLPRYHNWHNRRYMPYRPRPQEHGVGIKLGPIGLRGFVYSR